MSQLRKTAGALPFFCAVFLNAFVDLGHKIVVQNTVFKLYDGPLQVALTALVNSLILLPFILLMSPAGYLSDRFLKTAVMRAAAWAAVALTVLITVFYYLGWFKAAFAATFLLAAQSAIYSPAKLGYVKELFGKERLGEANGVVSALAIVAILAGIFAFSVLFEWGYARAGGPTSEAELLRAVAPIGFLLIASSIVEVVMTYRLKPGPATPIDAPFHMGRYLTFRLMAEDLAPLKHSRVIRLSIIGLATFWAVGQVMLAAFPAFFKEVTGSDNTIAVQGVLACSGIGIALGSFIAGKYSRNYIETGLLPLGALGIALGLGLLPLFETGLAFAICYLFIGVCGGIFIVPLNALIQYYARETELGKTLAANNWVQNVAMITFLALSASFSFYGWSAKALLQLMALVALIGGLYVIWQLPQSLTRFVLSAILSRRYHVSVQGMKNIPATGGVLMLGNHISWIDWAIVQLASPRPIRFVMIRSIYERWYLKWFFDLFGCIPIDSGPRSRRALQTVAECLDRGEVVCLFPEGTISRSGNLAAFRRGFERACEQAADAVIVPFYMRGLWGSRFSRSSARLKASSRALMRRDIVVAFGPPLPKDTRADVVKRRVLDLSARSWQAYAMELPTLSAGFIKNAKGKLRKTAIIDASLQRELTYLQTLVIALLFARHVRRASRAERVGVLMPMSAPGAIINVACLLAGRTVVNLNYTSSPTALRAALDQAGIDTVYTSRRFMDRLERKGIDAETLLAGRRIVDMEVAGKEFGGVRKVVTLLSALLLPAGLLNRLYNHSRDSEAPATILFSSGSEGTPKGVVLSHRNLHSNVKQIAEILNMEGDDAMMANLPLFHAFGLTVNQWLPMIEGCPMICQADPTDVLGSAKAVARYRATIMCATPTFLRLYCRNQKVHPLMLESLRFVVAGAEKLSSEVRANFAHKFNKTLLEGYGTTETSPVASCNLPDIIDVQTFSVQHGHKPGSVGLPLPGTSCAIVDPDTFTELPTGEAGMILLNGVQVMQGYLGNPEKTQQVLRGINGDTWYVTGDKGFLDEDGYLYIVDRYSRFAKIGGEMVSLTAVEDAIVKALGAVEAEVVVTQLPDAKKGEKLVVLCSVPLEVDRIKQQMLAAGMTPLALPGDWFTVDTMPKLGSGKTDFVRARQLAEQLLGDGQRAAAVS